MYNKLSGNEDITVWDLTDSIGKREIRKAIQILDKLTNQEETPIKILATVSIILKRVYNCKLIILQNRSTSIALALEPRLQFLSKKYEQHASNYTEEELYKIIKALEELKELYHNTKEKTDLKEGLKTILQSIAEK